MRKIEWKKSLDETLSMTYVLTVNDRETTIKFTAWDIRQEMVKIGDAKAKQNLVEDVRQIVAAPVKGLSAEEQRAIVDGLNQLLLTVNA